MERPIQQTWNRRVHKSMAKEKAKKGVGSHPGGLLTASWKNKRKEANNKRNYEKSMKEAKGLHDLPFRARLSCNGEKPRLVRGERRIIKSVGFLVIS
jgi:hypothetical protein